MWYASKYTKLSRQARTRINQTSKLGVQSLLPPRSEAAGLGGSFPSDPADCFIVGAALEMDVPLVTKDQRISDWGRIETIW